MGGQLESLSQNYPNPISSNRHGTTSTTVSFSVQKYNLVKITVMDVLGREMSVLTNQEYPAGEHSVMFNAAFLPTGIYFYKMSAGNFVAVRKMAVIR